MIALALAFVVAAVAPATANPAQQHIALVRKAIDAGNVAYIATWQRGDAKAFAALYTLDASSLNQDGSVVRGRANIEAAQAKSIARAALLHGTITTTDLLVDGGTAYEEGTYAFTLKSKKKAATEFKGRYLTIWAQQPDGAWKIRTDAGLPALPCGKEH